MHEPPRYPGRIRTDETNAFAHHTMRVRVPAIVRGVLERNREYEPAVVQAVEALAVELASDAPLPPNTGGTPGAEEARAALARRAEERWLHTDWFFAETYAYRQLVERVRYWDTGRDPFAAHKAEEYASPAHAEAFERSLALAGKKDERLAALLGAALFGNRIDLSFAASLAHGLDAAHDDLIVDQREAAVRLVLGGTGPVHLIVDNAGTELTLDLVLADFLLHELSLPVVLHLKEHPTFVSDATQRDVQRFLGLAAEPFAFVRSSAADACVERLATAVRSGRLALAPHPYWNGPESLWDLPPGLAARFGGARLAVLKGDANYRRAVGDALWPAETPFAEVTAYFPAPLLALRTLKSDPIVGLAPGQAELLERADAGWRVNGRRGVASVGGSAAGLTKARAGNT
jgi:hypothetical protein